MRKLWIPTALILIFILMAACGGKTNNNTDQPKSQNIVAFPSAEVEELYKKNNCLSCHGTGLGGRVGVETNLETVGDRLTKEQIIQQISKGSKNMPPYEKIMRPEEIELLADWLSTMK